MKTRFFPMLLAGLMAAVAATDAAESAADKQRGLVAVLKSNASPAEKAISCKRLAICGDKDAVPALAPLLLDPQLASWARIALEAIPDPAATGALCDSLGKLQGRLLVGAINSLGVRGDAQALTVLAEKLKDSDPEVASAAAEAMGRIGGDAAAGALLPMLAKAVPAARPAVAYGCILCAEKLLAAGKQSDAAMLYEAVRNANVSKQRTIEATRGLILARPVAAIPLLVELLQSPDQKMHRLGLGVARELRGREVTKALLAALDQATPDRQTHLLLALADRGDTEVLPAAVKAAKTGTPQLRTVAIGVLERLGSPAAVPTLLAVATEDDAELAQTAKFALARMAGADVDAAVVSMLSDPEPQKRRLALDLLTQRQATGAVPSLLKAAQDPDDQVRLASIKALGDFAGTAELPAVLQLLVKGRSAAEIQATERAVSSICARSAKPSTGNIVIVKAVYGALPNGPAADVTAKVADMVKGGATSVTASNNNFGDPAGGLVKKLRVDFKVAGQAISRIASETETITLASDTVDPACADAVFAALSNAPVAPKLALLRVLRSMGGPRALAAVRSATTDANAETKDAAVRALCDWPGTEALPDLAQLAKSSANPTVKILALRGCIRLAALLDDSGGQKLAALKDAMALAARNEEKTLVLAALGKIPSSDSLALVGPYLDTPDLKEEACLAAVAIAELIPQPKPALVAQTMRRVMTATTNQQLAQRAKALAGN